MNRHTEHVLIAGGGVAALEAMLALRKLAGERLSIELLAPEADFSYRPLAVAEPFGLAKAQRFELSSLAEEAGALVRQGALVSVDASRRLAYTSSVGPVPYRALLIACGAVPNEAIPGAITFRGPADTPRMQQLLGEIEDGAVRQVAFVVPAGAVWSLPAYELALMTGSWLLARGIDDVTVTLVTPEEAPLHLFGREASDAVRGLLEERGIVIHTRAYPAEAKAGKLLLRAGRPIPADRVVALPRLHGPRIGGVPQTFEGFIPIDPHGRVPGVDDVYAAGDITTFPVKQGGIATQLADAAAHAIAADLGADVTAPPFKPVLRGLLVTGGIPSYLRAEIAGNEDVTSHVSETPLWWPPAKIVGHHLAPLLARLAGAEASTPVDVVVDTVRVEVELDPNTTGARRDQVLRTLVETAEQDAPAPNIGDVMTADPLVVAPEDTLGEVAEQMHRRDVGSALVADYGRLIGIVTSRDLLRAVAARVHTSEARIRFWMTADPITVTASMTLDNAEALMAEHGIHHLPVVDGERAIGMVGARDLALAQVPIAVP
jgi:sulfide:quinone oxidoreductase